MEHLAITLQAPTQLSLLYRLSKIVSETGCSVIKSQALALNTEQAIGILAAGNWSMIARLEVALNALQNELGIQVFYKRTKSLLLDYPCFNFQVQLIGLNQPHLIHQIVDFFQLEEAAILLLNSHSYFATTTQAQMIIIDLEIQTPATIIIADLRERLILFCDELNLDSMMELNHH